MNRKEQETEEMPSVLCMYPTAYLHRPEEGRKIRDRIDENVEILCSAFDEHEDADKLVSVLCKLADDVKALAHYKGFYEGVYLAQRLAKVPKKKGERYKEEIAGIIIQHPDWTARQIFRELDWRKIRLVHFGRVPKAENKKWSHVADESPYKVLISRLRSYVNDRYQVKGLKRLMKEHKKLRREK